MTILATYLVYTFKLLLPSQIFFIVKIKDCHKLEQMW